MQDDHTHERALAHFEELIGLRSTFSGHKLVLLSIDHAIGNVFEPENHDEISKYVTKIKELVDVVQKTNELGVGITGIEIPLPNLHVSEAKPQYEKVNAKLEKLRDVRQQLAVLGIPTGGVETAMADILMKHGAALAVKVPEEPAIVKQQTPSEIKSALSNHVPSQLRKHYFLTSTCTPGSACSLKRSAPMDDTGNAKPKGVSQGEANETKRRKASLNFRSLGGKECTEAWRVPVNKVGTEGLSIMSTGSDGSLSLSFDTKSQSIMVFVKEQCLSTTYPCLELIPAYIHSIKRNSLETTNMFKARLSMRDGFKKLHTIDVVFASIKDWETFLEKIRLSCYHDIDSTDEVMDELFEKGLWVERRNRVSGTVAKTKSMEIVEFQ